MRALPVGLVFALAGTSATAQPEVRFDGWNVQYEMPEAWQIGRSIGRLHVLTSTTAAGAIFVGPGLYGNAREALADLTRFYQSLGMPPAYPVEQARETRVGAYQAVTALYAAVDQMGRPVQGRYVAVFTPHGTGFAILAMTTPDRMSALRQTADRIAASVRATAPETNTQAVAALAGRWTYYDGARSSGASGNFSRGGSSRSVDQTVAFDGQGRFQYQSSATVNVNATNGMAGASGGGTQSDQGTYTVIGTTLVLTGSAGPSTFEIQILGDRIIADGRTYLRSQ